jgi:Fe-Mn family superoxide dismutase
MYEIKNYSHLKGIGKISEEAMQMHLKLYEGYVKNTNLLVEKFEFLKTVEEEYFTKFLPEWTELHRRFGWEWNGMRLHELFFDSLSNIVESPNVLEGEVKSRIEKDFGSIENWKKDFTRLAKMRGMGWIMLVEDNKTKRLLNTWVNEHDAGMLGDVKVVLNIDMFEHAYVKDFGLDRQAYIDSVFAHIDWAVVSERLTEVVI